MVLTSLTYQDSAPGASSCVDLPRGGLSARPWTQSRAFYANQRRQSTRSTPLRTRSKTAKAPSPARRNRASLTCMTQAASSARAWIGTIVFLFLAPGVVAGILPWLISGWRWYDWGGAAAIVVPIAWIAIAIGAVVL